jgi:HEAT repeat protein
LSKPVRVYVTNVQAAGAGAAQFLPTLIPLAIEALESTDWTTRKAAADTLSRLASTLGPALYNFKKDCVEALEASRFDKVSTGASNCFLMP